MGVVAVEDGAGEEEVADDAGGGDERVDGGCFGQNLVSSRNRVVL